MNLGVARLPGLELHCLAPVDQVPGMLTDRRAM